MLKCLLSGPAEEDMFAVWIHIAKDNPAAADRMIDRFSEAFERISLYPESGEGYLHPASPLRKIIVSPYVIFYRIGEQQIDVVRILHSAQKWEDLL